jgi:hypothetical protein
VRWRRPGLRGRWWFVRGWLGCGTAGNAGAGQGAAACGGHGVEGGFAGRAGQVSRGSAGGSALPPADIGTAAGPGLRRLVLPGRIIRAGAGPPGVRAEQHGCGTLTGLPGRLPFPGPDGGSGLGCVCHDPRVSGHVCHNPQKKGAAPPGACSPLRVTPWTWPRSPNGALSRPDGRECSQDGSSRQGAAAMTSGTVPGAGRRSRDRIFAGAQRSLRRSRYLPSSAVCDPSPAGVWAMAARRRSFSSLSLP